MFVVDPLEKVVLLGVLCDYSSHLLKDVMLFVRETTNGHARD